MSLKFINNAILVLESCFFDKLQGMFRSSYSKNLKYYAIFQPSSLDEIAVRLGFHNHCPFLVLL